jgi:hypothetical protein
MYRVVGTAKTVCIEEWRVQRLDGFHVVELLRNLELAALYFKVQGSSPSAEFPQLRGKALTSEPEPLQIL